MPYTLGDGGPSAVGSITIFVQDDVPEPASWLLLASGVLMLIGYISCIRLASNVQRAGGEKIGTTPGHRRDRWVAYPFLSYRQYSAGKTKTPRRSQISDNPKLMTNAASTRPIALRLRDPSFFTSRCLSIVRTWFSSTTDASIQSSLASATATSVG